MNTTIINQSMDGLGITMGLWALTFAIYFIVGIAVLTLIERQRRIAALCARIEGVWAWVAVLVWPLTVLWLLLVLLQDRLDG